MTDSRIQRGQQWLKNLLQIIGVSAEVKAELQHVTAAEGGEPDSDSYWLTIDQSQLQPEQIQILLGSEGTVLDAVQYLANALLNLNQPPEQQAAYTIELDGYRVRRQAEIQQLAESAAEQARAAGKEVEIKSLSSAERRQVHTFLKSFEDLETYSRGKEPHRHLVVKYVPAGSYDQEEDILT